MERQHLIDPDVLSAVLKRALSQGGQYADIFIETSRPCLVRMEDERIEQALVGSVQGAGIRLIFGEKTAYAYSNDLSAPALMEAAGALANAARNQSPSEVIDLSTRTPAFSLPVEVPPEDVPIADKVAMVKRANSAVRALGAGVRQVGVTIKDYVQRVQIATSTGQHASGERTQVVGVVQVVATDEGVIQTGYEPLGGACGYEIFAGDALEAIGIEAATRALKMLKARKAPGGRMPVVISSEAGGTMIHEAIGHGLEADLAGTGLSRFSGRMGQAVASKLVTVLDDATLSGKRGSYHFDDEGTPGRRNVLVDQGVLVGYMHDRLSAMKLNAEPTGNGRRESYRHRPIPRMTNTFIAPGTSDPQEILRCTQSGLFVRKMGGGQVDTVSGEFVFDVTEGYLIENGKLGELVRGATLTGNGPDVLMSIDMVASDLGFSIGTCGKDGQGVPVSDAMPTLRIPEMVVGGQA